MIFDPEMTLFISSKTQVPVILSEAKNLMVISDIIRLLMIFICNHFSIPISLVSLLFQPAEPYWQLIHHPTGSMFEILLYCLLNFQYED
jgi:hypothetical protein